MDGKIDWNKYFDHIFCIHYISEDRIERHHQLINELKRVGIYDSGIFSFIYDENSIITNEIYENVRNNEYCSYDKYAKRVTINHYKAFNISKFCNYKKILILEDDICFLKDIQQIEYYLNQASNNDTDLIMYDYITYKMDNENELNCFATCYQLNYNGIIKMIENIEYENMYVIDQYFSTLNNYIFYIGNYQQNVYFPQQLSISKCEKRLAIQRNNEAYQNGGININYDEYNL